MDDYATKHELPVRVLFVCLGNICRSPVAEGVFRRMVTDAGLADRIDVDSAGTGDWHVGDRPHPQSTAVAASRGLRLEGSARQVRPTDLSDFDYIIAMDASNLADLHELTRHAPAARAHIQRLREFDPGASAAEHDVPDPYGGGSDGFERVQDVIERACRGLLDHLRQNHPL